MVNINIKFNNGSTSSFVYDSSPILTNTLVTDIGKLNYPDSYNSKINEYIKIIYMGKILDQNENLPLDESKTDYIFHCVIKKIPDEVFIVEKSKEVELDQVEKLLANENFINILRQRVVFEFIENNLSKPDLIISKFTANSINYNKYKQQLDILKDMGFTDNDDLYNLLEKSNGNVESVINILMS
jgi:hypothetical protein